MVKMVQFSHVSNRNWQNFDVQIGKEKIMRKNIRNIFVVAGMMAMMTGSAVLVHAAPPTTNTTNTTQTNTPTNNNTNTTNGWVQKQSGNQTVWNYYENGIMLKSQWKQITTSGLWYYFDANGVMLTGWGDGKLADYYFEDSGAMATGWREISNDRNTSYGPGGNTGEKGWYYFGSDGKVVYGWKKINNSWYYFNDGEVDDFEDGQMVYGEVEIDGDEYYFGNSSDGVMKTGLVKVTNSQNSNRPGGTSETESYFYGSNGVKVVDGWAKYNNKWYYMDEDGHMMKGFIGFDSSFNILSDPTDVDRATYVNYLDDNGEMVTGWLDLGETEQTRPGQDLSNQYYYFKSDGTMVTDWYKINSKWYYLSPETTSEYQKGQLVTGLYTIEDKNYYFDKSGVMSTSSWETVEVGSSKYDIYLASDGVMLQGKSDDDLLVEKVGSKYYVFDENGYCLKSTTVYLNGTKWTINRGNLPAGTSIYTINRSGVATKGTLK